MYTVRFICIFYIINYLVKKSALLTLKAFISILIILISISISAVLFFGYEGILSGRINFVGMGPNVSADISIMILTMTIFAEKKALIGKAWLFACILFVLMYLPLTGSRRSLFFLALALMYWNTRLIFMFMTCLFLVVIMFFVEDIGVLEFENFVAISRTIETFSQISAGTFEDGRYLVLTSVISLLYEFPFGVGLSDWAIQSEFSKQNYGIDSHSHNWFFQFYLKFGLLALCLFIWLFKYIFIFFKNKLFFQTLFIIVISLTGYGWWNIKWVTVLFFFFLFYIKP